MLLGATRPTWPHASFLVPQAVVLVALNSCARCSWGATRPDCSGKMTRSGFFSGHQKMNRSGSREQP